MFFAACFLVDDKSEENQERWGQRLKSYFVMVKSFIAAGKVMAKIIASYFQIATSLAVNFNLVFPFRFTIFMKWFSFINFDLGSLMPVGCMVKFNHFTSLYGMTTSSLLVMIVLAIASRVALRFNSKNQQYLVALEKDKQLMEQESNNKEKNVLALQPTPLKKFRSGAMAVIAINRMKKQAPESKKINWGTFLFNNLLVFSFLILPTVSTKILQTMGCEKLVDDDEKINDAHGREGYYLKVDRSIRCDSSDAKRLGSNPEHAKAWWYAILMIFIFILGIPLGYYVLLWIQRFDVDPGQDALVGQRTAKRFNKETKSWEFFELKPRKSEPAKFIFGLITINQISQKGRWVKWKEKEVFNFIDLKKEGETPESWKYVESLNTTEAKFCAVFIRKQREETNHRLKRLAFLYDSYEPRCWAFEVFETFRRIMLTGGLVFLRPGTASEIVASMLICLFSMRIYAQYHPFIDSKHDKLAEAAQWQLFFTLFGALAIRVKLDGENLQDRGLFGALLAYMQFIIIFLIVFQSMQKKNEDGEEEPIIETISRFQLWAN